MHFKYAVYIELQTLFKPLNMIIHGIYRCVQRVNFQETMNTIDLTILIVVMLNKRNKGSL